MALTLITDDVLFVIIDALQIEDIILLGAASRRLRTITTNTTGEKRVWAPRLLTKELGLGTAGIDAATCLRLLSLSCSPRRLCLQSLPWRVARDDRDSNRVDKVYSWRPRDGVPASLLLRPAYDLDLIICELYESTSRPGTVWNLAYKVVRLMDCELAGFPHEMTIPLDIPIPGGHKNEGPYLELRLFALVNGVVAPIADTGALEGAVDDRCAAWNSPFQPAQEYGETWIDTYFSFDMDFDDQDDVRNFECVKICFSENEQSAPPQYLERPVPVPTGTLRPGFDGFHRFFRHHSFRAQPTALFATDSMPAAPFSPDGNWPKRGLGGIDPNLDEVPAEKEDRWVVHGDRPQEWLPRNG